MSLSRTITILGMAGLAAVAQPAGALESDRQQPLQVNADSTRGTLGDGITVLKGNVEVRQGTLHIRADEAEVDKVEGKVRTVTLRGAPAYMAQEIEQQGKVEARARTIVYQVSSGLVTMTGEADVRHPQYEVSGETLTYDLGAQHFQGSGDAQGNGRIQIRLDPEVLPADADPAEPGEEAEPDAADG